MERPLWDRIQEIYHSAMPVPRSERSAFLEAACNNDPVLIHEIKALLHADDIAAGFLEAPVFELGLRIMSNGQNSSNGDGPLPEQNLAGTMIEGKYWVERELSQGGMGKVYLTRDVSLHDRPTVIKVLLPVALGNPYLKKKNFQEVEALSRIDHPNIVNLYGAGELPDGSPYIAMQYVEGETLRSQILGEGMDLERAALILKDLGAAIEDFHERGIFHRDLKPENILLKPFRGRKELVKIVDFGIAQVKDSVFGPSTASNSPVGTVRYMSPEQLRGGEQITTASDIYSLAVVAFEMITGRHPFNPSSAPDLLELQRKGVQLNPIALRPSVPTEARVVLLRALSFEPAARYQSAEEFGDQLARALTRNAGAIGVPPPQPLITRLAGGPFKYVLAGLVIALISVTVALIRNRPSPRTDEKLGFVTEPTPTPAIPNPGAARSLIYWLNVQKMRNGRPYQQAFPSSGKGIFETGYKFRLNVSSPDPGYLYVFNEGTPSQSGTNFTILYPTPQTNGGLATLGANQVVQTNWNIFAGQPGTENFWIVWSVLPVPELEAAKTEAFKNANGALIGESLVAARQFLITKDNEKKTRYTTDKDANQTTVRGNGDLLVRLVEFQHQ
jgi:serine/threonine protein kinase